MPPLSSRLARTELAATFAMAARARALKAAGHNIISLSLGEPDFPTPEHVIEAAHAAAKRGETKYPPLSGTAALKEAVRQKYLADQKLDVPLENILVTNGGKQAIFNILMAVTDEAGEGAGNEVIIPAPAWAGYEQTVNFAGATPIFAPTSAAKHFVLQPEDLEAAITPRTRLLILNYPNNPTGAAITAPALEALATVLRRHPEIWILADDIYEKLLFDGQTYVTLAAIAPDLQNRTITLTGVSKTYAMTGWRIGFLAGPETIIKAASLVQATATSGVSTIGQAAALAALTGPQDFLDTRAAAYQARRDLMCDALQTIPHMRCHQPQGAFYVFPDISAFLTKTTPAGHTLLTDSDFAKTLLDEAHVAVVQGAAFAAPGFIRLSTASSEPTLREACHRIARFCAQLT